MQKLRVIKYSEKKFLTFFELKNINSSLFLFRKEEGKVALNTPFNITLKQCMGMGGDVKHPPSHPPRQFFFSAIA